MLGEQLMLNRLEAKTYETIAEDQLKKLVGDYEIKGVLKLSVKVHDGKLFIQGEGQPEFEVNAISTTVFESQATGIKLEFDSAESPTNFKLYQVGNIYTAEKSK